MRTKITILAIAAICSINMASAGDVTGLTTFTSGTPAVASEVNENFNAVKTAVDDNNSRITANFAATEDNDNGIDANAAAITALAGHGHCIGDPSGGSGSYQRVCT